MKYTYTSKTQFFYSKSIYKVYVCMSLCSPCFLRCLKIDRQHTITVSSHVLRGWSSAAKKATAAGQTAKWHSTLITLLKFISSSQSMIRGSFKDHVMSVVRLPSSRMQYVLYITSPKALNRIPNWTWHGYSTYIAQITLFHAEFWSQAKIRRP